MRNLKSLLLIAFIALSFGAAQAQKVAHVNYERVIANMPETRALQVEIAKISKTYKDDIDGMVNKFKAKLKKYEAEAPTQTDAVNQQRGQEIQQDKSRISQAEQAAYQEIQEKQQKGLGPIVKKVFGSGRMWIEIGIEDKCCMKENPFFEIKIWRYQHDMVRLGKNEPVGKIF